MGITFFAIGFLLWYILRPDQIDVHATAPELTLTAEHLITNLKNQHKEDTPLATEKVVEIEGSIREINTLNNRFTILLEGGGDGTALVICDMQSDQVKNLVRLHTKDTIKVKGIFKGFLKDAILLNCVITHSNFHE